MAPCRLPIRILGVEMAANTGFQAEDRLSAIIERNTKLKDIKHTWSFSWQMISEYVRSVKSNFLYQPVPGMFLTGKIFDSTAPRSAHQAASSLIGALWPNGGRTIRIEPPHTMPKAARQDPVVKEFYHGLTERVIEAFDEPRAGFMLALQEYMEDQVVFGTSGIYADEQDNDPDCPVIFKAVDVKVASIAEGADGLIDTVYQERERTVRQVVQEYGIDDVAEPTKVLYNAGQLEEKVMVLHAIEPRTETPVSFGNRFLPVASIHIDMQGMKTMKESGFYEMPIFITRFTKTMGEVYGRSLAFEAMPDILELNYKRETGIVADEVMLRPPMAFYHDGSLGGGSLDVSAGAVNVFNTNGRTGQMNQKIFEQLVTVGDIEPTYKRMEVLEQSIEAQFMVDKMTDLGNDSRMTLGETNIRNDMRGQALGLIYSRQILELFTRIVTFVFNVMWRRNLLGISAQMAQEGDLVIPGPVQALIDSGRTAYKIVFISPAARIMRNEELKGILQTVQSATEMSEGGYPQAWDVCDGDESLRRIQDLTGGPSAIIRDADAIAQIRQQRDQMQAQQQQMVNQESQSKTVQNLGKAAHEASRAGLPLQAIMPQGQTA